MPLRALILLLTLACPAAALGQASLSAGVAIPVSPVGFTDTYNPGFGISGSFPLPIRMLVVQPRLTAGFDVLQVDGTLLEERGEELDVEIEGGDFSIIHVGFDVQFIRSSGTIKPYASPFLGFAIFSFADLQVNGISVDGGQGEAAATIGAALGVAVRLPFGPHVFLEGRLLHAFTEDDDTTWAPVRLGVAVDLN